MIDTNELKMKGELARKLLCITEDLGVMKKDGENTHSRYKYTSYEELNARLKELLVRHKVMIIPSFTEVTEESITSGTKPAIRSLIKAEIEIIDIDSGYSIIKHAFGADNDHGGKSLGQAITELMKRFEFKLFHVSTTGEADPDAKTVEGSFSRNGYSKPNGQPNSSKLATLKRLASDIGKGINELEKIAQKEFHVSAEELTKEQMIEIHQNYKV